VGMMCFYILWASKYIVWDSVISPQNELNDWCLSICGESAKGPRFLCSRGFEDKNPYSISTNTEKKEFRENQTVWCVTYVTSKLGGYPLHGGCPITSTNNIVTFVSNSREIQHGLSDAK
jgi:hypothetical protein